MGENDSQGTKLTKRACTYVVVRQELNIDKARCQRRLGSTMGPQQSRNRDDPRLRPHGKLQPLSDSLNDCL